MHEREIGTDPFCCRNAGVHPAGGGAGLAGEVVDARRILVLAVYEDES
jgi:hypothetical protein